MSGFRSPRTARCTCSRWTERPSRYARFEDRMTCRRAGRTANVVVIPVESNGTSGYAAYVRIGRGRKTLVGNYESQTRARQLARRAACLW